MKQLIKRIISPSNIFALQCTYYKYFGRNRFHGLKNNTLSIGNSILRKTMFNIHGKNCSITIGKNNRFNNCSFDIFGDNCHIVIGEWNLFNETNFWLEDNRSSIEIGDYNILCGKTTLGVAEGTNLKIGNDSLFSINIYISTSDSHSVIDRTTNKRTNKSENINIGDHVWIGRDVTVGKGVNIANDTIIGGKSFVTKSFAEYHIAIAGVPAKIIKRDCTWDANRI